MAVYAYKAQDATGIAISGTLLADSPAEGRRLLRERGLRIEQFLPALRHSAKQRGGFTSQSGRQACVAEFTRLLALLLSNGVALRDALDCLIEQASGVWKIVLRDVRGTFDAGAAFAEALARHPAWFGEITLGAVRVGEQAGTLEVALRQVSEYLRAQDHLTARLRAALAYPVVLLITSIGVVLFLMTYVIPQLMTVIESSGQRLPASTRFLKACSDVLTQHWAILLLGALVVSATVIAILRTPAGRRTWQRWVMRSPLLGILVRKSLIARFAQQMSMMLASGIPFVEALQRVRGSTANRVLARELETMEQAVTAGSDIAPALTRSEIFPALVVQLMAVGQSSGELTTVLDQLREGYEIEVKLAIDKFTAALEPLMITLMAGVVGFIVFSTLMPILQATRMMS